MPRDEIDDRTRRWVLHELVPITRKQGLAMRPDLRERNTLLWVRDHWEATYSSFYLCSNFDSETRLCGAYDDRPPVCAGYPLYDAPPRVDAVPSLPPECSFNADYGRPVADWQPVALLPPPPR